MRQAGGRNVRVFGSVATGDDHDGSDIDLLFTRDRPMGLMTIGRLERQVSIPAPFGRTVGREDIRCNGGTAGSLTNLRVRDLLDMLVDLVPDDSLRPEFRNRVLGEAVPL